MYGIIELAKRTVNLQRSPPEGHAQAYREMMRQACDAAKREAKRRKKGQMADDAQELLVLILPRLLLPAPKRTPGNNTKVKRVLKRCRKRHNCDNKRPSWWEKD